MNIDMRIDFSSYKNYIESINKKITGETLYSPILLNNETLIFPFERIKRNYLVISLNNNNPLIYVIENNEFFSCLETHKFLKFKKNIGKTIIQKISIAEDDFIITITLENICENKQILLVAELVSKKPDLLLIQDDKIIESFLGKHSINESYKSLRKTIDFSINENITNEYLTKHFQNEINIRKKQKYSAFTKFLKAKIKSINRKIAQINNDVSVAKSNLVCEDIANEIFTLELNLKGHYDSICLSNGCINLDQSKTLLENIEKLYKKTKKAKETIRRSEINLANAKKELEEFEEIFNNFLISDEKNADKLVELYCNVNKKREVEATIFNRPYYINLNGTYFYFGKNASQNDFLSFVMKLDRDFTWMHIKDLSGSHIVICNKKPTENEILFGCELALICSKVTAAEIIYTKKKNIRRGHALGEATVKNYTTIKLNSIRQESYEIFAQAKKLD